MDGMEKNMRWFAHNMLVSSVRFAFSCAVVAIKRPLNRK